VFVTVSQLKAQVTDTVKIEAPSAEQDEEYTNDKTEQEDTIEPKDTMLTVTRWNYPADSLQKIKTQKEFVYIINLDSLLKAKQDEDLKKELKTEPVSQVRPTAVFSLFRFLLWSIAIFALLFVLYRLFLSEKGMFAAPTKNKKLQLVEELITDEVFLEKRLTEAIQKADYRLAIRFLYLQALNKLNDKGWLLLSPDKTNYQYVQEMKNKQFKNEFARITLHYEYAWYGDFKIEETVFKPVKLEFDQFNNKLKQG
jgi:hypothetical protein